MQAEQQREREALRDMIESYGFAFHTAVSIPSMHDKMREKAEGILESILDRAALSHPSPQGWQEIEARAVARTREECAVLCSIESVVFATKPEGRAALRCAAVIRALGERT